MPGTEINLLIRGENIYGTKNRRIGSYLEKKVPLEKQ
jgi:hypothetical protein